MHGISKRRLLLGAAGVLTALMISGPVAAGGTGHGTVDVNDVTKDPHGGLVKGSDGGERNLQPDVKSKFLYDEILEFDPNIGSALRLQNEEIGRHP
jgi:hypothetical protein